MGGLIHKAKLESLLKQKGWARTLPAVLARPDTRLPCGIEALDSLLSGGFPRGYISEITGPISSGKTTVLLSLLSSASRQGEAVACLDANMLDPVSASRRLVDLEKLLWIRCQAADQVLKAAEILCRGGNFGVIAADLNGFSRLPVWIWRHAWFRLQRRVEGSKTVLLILAPVPAAGSAARLSLRLHPAHSCWRGQQSFWKLLQGLNLEARIVRAQASPSRKTAKIQAHIGPRLSLHQERRHQSLKEEKR